MLNEVKIFFDNVVHFRQLLKEGVGESTIVDAINKHKIVYIYYVGDHLISRGYRSVKPMVLGYSISKETETEGDYMLLRAWEIAGNSDSKKMYTDEKGRRKYGWRLFRVDKITSFLPTGKFFNTNTDKFANTEWVEDYNPNDSQMKNIIAAVEFDTGKPQTNQVGDTTAQEIPEPDSAFKGQKEKFQYFSKMGKKQRDITADEVKDLWDWAIKNRHKTSRERLLVVTDQHGDMILKDANQKTQIPPDSIVGNLKDLYIRLVKPNEKVDTSFLDNQKNDALKNVNKINQPNIAQENLNKRTFFK